MMNMPRCGMPDNMGYSNNARRKRFDAVTRWPQSDLTWRLNTATNDLSRNEIRRIMAEALKVSGNIPYDPLRSKHDPYITERSSHTLFLRL